jgi:hypothetical protein
MPRTARQLPGWVTVPLGEMYNPVFIIDTALPAALRDRFASP